MIAPAKAQSQRVIAEQGGGGLRQEGSVRVQTSINFFVAGPTGDSEEAQKLRDRARRTVYEMAARECDLLREVLARDCRMESVNTNINRQFGPQQAEGFNISGSMGFQITLK
ncbi:hypothetical protein BwSH20_50400 [Bradyrhizobium ottawaense]|nr:hypothetical protein SG09_67680 [Bradyrhizobium ottawaense]GMO24967.1 hypothetical protein BwSF12_20010 [Bradyrhizobium ottawaense]GMO37671.1 hypothetical protein BwSF21_46090 [Bradyrhizobium ottawaense]GMO49654.1 hypothetical protein BwSH14_69950 [Bradyrhizobium ottawaense]GMO62946.1 hypothetical protein BwSG20_20020 [Bradyrhizobium ottawaense]